MASAGVRSAPGTRSLCRFRTQKEPSLRGTVDESLGAQSELLKQPKLQAQWEGGLALRRSLQATSAIVPLQHAAWPSIPGGRGDAEPQHSQLT